MSLGFVDKCRGFRAKTETDLLRYFYKNTTPIGMDRYRSVLANNQRCALGVDNPKKILSNNKKNRVKNSVDIRSKISNTGYNKIDEISKHSQYEIYAMLAVSGRYS